MGFYVNFLLSSGTLKFYKYADRLASVLGQPKIPFT